MADSRHLEVSKNGSTNQHKIWRGDGSCPSEPYSQLKFPSFKNGTWCTAATLQTGKSLNLSKFPSVLDTVVWVGSGSKALSTQFMSYRTFIVKLYYKY